MKFIDFFAREGILRHAIVQSPGEKRFVAKMCPKHRAGRHPKGEPRTLSSYSLQATDIQGAGELPLSITNSQPYQCTTVQKMP